MFNKKEIMDERQQLEVYRIEHVCFWIMFWALFAGVIIESYIMGAGWGQMAVEWIALVVGAIGTVIGCVKKGQWGCTFHPSMKNYILISLFASLAMGIILIIGKYYQYENVRDDIGMLLAMGGIFAASMFVLLFIAFVIVGGLIKRKEKKLADEFTEDEK